MKGSMDDSRCAPQGRQAAWRNLRRGSGCLLLLAAIGSANGVYAAPAETAPATVQLTCQEGWNTVFADRETVFHVTVLAREAFRGRATIELSAGGHAVARREQAVAAAPGAPAAVKIAERIPPVRPGIRFPVTLTVSLVAEGAKEPAAVLRKELLAFPDDAFIVRREWLKKLGLQVWDPEGKTVALLEKAEVTFRRVDNLAAALDPTNVVLVGEGLDPDRHSNLLPMLVEAAARGTRILWLAPAPGKLGSMPGSAGAELPVPDTVVFRHTEIITELDKKLDAVAWPPDGRVATTRFQLQPDRTRVAVEAGGDAEGWPWVELRFGERGRLFLCGFPLVARWDATPTARFLLVSLVERLVEEKKADTEPAQRGSRTEGEEISKESGNPASK